jgi:hypothetical protein
MEIEYQNTKTDYHSFYKSYFVDKLKKRGWIEVLVCLIFAFSITLGTYDWHIILFFLIVTVFFLIFYLRPYLIAIRRLNKSIAKNKGLLERVKLIVADSGIIIESSGKSFEWDWLNIRAVKAYNNCIQIQLIDKSSLLIPKRSFASKDEEIDFLGIIESGIIKAREVLNASLSKFSKKSKPPYLVGLICLAPILSAYAGLAILLFGIFKYKDKWFSLIGVAGIVWTVVFIETIPYASKHISFIRNGYVSLSQIELNTLVKNIEFYKLQHGEYPDSLKQLLRDDTSASIVDPIRFNQDNQNEEFNYQKSGDKYTLYSSGEDGIPHTKDDLYPKFSITDSAKIGLIKQGQNSRLKINPSP